MITERRLRATITLGTGLYGQTVGDTVPIRGYRMTCEMQSYGGASMGEAQIRIFGLPLELMNRLTTIGPVITEMAFKNEITVEASTDLGFTVVYIGNIQSAYGDFAGAPDVALNIMAFSGANNALKPVAPTSYPGQVLASNIMQSLAVAGGYSFENYGVTVTLTDSYFDGTIIQRIRKVAEAGNFNFSLDLDNLAIWPLKGTRGGVIPVVSPSTNMVGYPQLSSQGIIVKSLFLESAKMGGRIKVEGSQLVMANGQWAISSLAHSLSSQVPGGPWFSTMTCFFNG